MKPATNTMTGTKQRAKSSLSHPQDFLERLRRVKPSGHHQWLASCPTAAHAHGDVKQSLSVKLERDRILLHCFAGCGPEAVVQSVGLELSDLFFGGSKSSSPYRPKPVVQARVSVKQCEAKPISDALHVQHWQRLEQLQDIPPAAQNRGILDVNECRALGIAASGDDAVLAITDPLGNIVALKQRRYVVGENQSRYFYLTKDCGTPAWCSPCFFTAEKIMVVEGELNAMVLSLARQNNDPDIAFMGVAGTNGSLWLKSLRGRFVYVYADGDEAGRKARECWAQAATQAGAKAVYKLKPLPDLIDFCDIAAKQGREALREGMLKCLL